MIKNTETNVVSYLKEQDDTDKLIGYYSSFYRLKRAVAIYKRFLKFLQGKKVDGNSKLSIEEIDQAEQSIIRYSQQVHFPEEVRVLNGKMD